MELIVYCDEILHSHLSSSSALWYNRGYNIWFFLSTLNRNKLRKSSRYLRIPIIFYWSKSACQAVVSIPQMFKGDPGASYATPCNGIVSHGAPIAYVAISKHPLYFTVWTQLRLRSHQNLSNFLPANNFCQLLRVTRKRSCTSAGNAQAQLHFRINRERLKLATSSIGRIRVFCRPHTRKQTQTKCVHDLRAPCGVSRSDRSTCARDNLRLFWSQEKPDYPQFWAPCQ